MGKVDILGLIVIALGIFLVFLGVTGGYKVFVSGSSSATSGSQAGISLPGQGSVPAANTAVPGITFNILNQDPVPTLGNLLGNKTNNPTPASIWQSIIQRIRSALHRGG
jgi:hypothetical protein